MLRRVRFSIVATLVVGLTNACIPAPVAPTATAVPASPSLVAAPSATAARPAQRLTRPAAPYGGDPPILLRALPEAGTFVARGRWQYDGVHGTLEQAAAIAEPLEHPAPSGTLVAIEHEGRTPGGYAISNELVIRDGAGGPERVVYRAPELFYWSGWSPDGRYIAVWEVDFLSGSVDLDGRPLLVIDAATGTRATLGRTLLDGSTAWAPPHTLAFVAGFGRAIWDDKRLRLWSPEAGTRDLTPEGIASYAPAWSGDGQSLYFASGPAGEYDPLAVFAGRGVGDRRIAVLDIATGARRSLAHAPGYVEEGARPSHDGTRLLVLRRKTVVSTDVRSIPDAPLEVWLTDTDGAHGTALVRITRGFGYSGWDPGPTEWNWSE